MADETRQSASLTKQSAWILAAKFMGFALNTALPLLIVRFLTQENVGVYRQAFLIAANASMVLPLGVSMSAYYFLNREPEKQASAVLNILLFNFLVGGLAFAVLGLFPEVLAPTFQSPEIIRLAPAIGLVIWLWLFSTFLETAALSLQQARLAAAFIVLSQVSKAALMVTAVIVFTSVDSLLYASAIIFLAQSIVLVAYLARRYPRFWRSFDLPFLKRQLAYALPFGISVLLYVVQTDVHNYFVSHSFSAADFAIYSVGCFQLPLIAMLYESVGAVMMPKMSQMQDEDRRTEMLQMTAAATQKLAFVYFPLFAYLMIVANEFIVTLFTRDYSASAAIFRINLLTLPLFSLVVDPVARAFPYAGRLLLKVRIGICIALLVIFWAGLGRFGLLEMIGIVVGAMFVEKIACAFISLRMLGVSRADVRLFEATGRLALAAGASAVVTFLIHVFFGQQLFSAGGRIGSWLTAAAAPRAAEFIGGCLFLGLLLALFGSIYLILADRLGAIGADDKRRVLSLLRRVPSRGAAIRAA